jgi:DNA-binding MarR family transcriptional regulator
MNRRLSSPQKLPYTTKQLLEFYKAKAVPLLPKPADNGIISVEEQEAEFRSLKASLHHKTRFFFVVNLHEMKLREVHGVENCLGYADKSFDFYRYLDIVHAEHSLPHTNSSRAMLEGLNTGKVKLKFIKHRYNTLMALRDSKGDNHLCKRMACVFQFNKKDQLTEYLNEFTILTKFDGEPFQILRDSTMKENEKILDDLLELAKYNFKKLKIFSDQHLQILRIYAYNKKMLVQEIAKELNIMKSSVTEQNKRIIEKAEKVFSKEFETAREVALHLKRAELM